MGLNTQPFLFAHSRSNKALELEEGKVSEGEREEYRGGVRLGPLHKLLMWTKSDTNRNKHYTEGIF